MGKTDTCKGDSFLERFLEFARRRDEVIGSNLMESASKWVLEKNYEDIYHYVQLYKHNTSVFLPYAKLATMTQEEFLALQDFSKTMVPLLEEEKALYAEVASYLGKPCFIS